jgi:hypothetical protein
MKSGELTLLGVWEAIFLIFYCLKMVELLHLRLILSLKVPLGTALKTSTGGLTCYSIPPLAAWWRHQLG